MAKTKDIFKSLNIKPNSQKVLDYLITHDSSPAKDIALNLSLPKSTVYDALEELINESLVTEYNEDRGRVFGVSDTDRLIRVSDQKIENLKKDQEKLLEYINNVQKEDTVSKPRIKFYAGNEGIKQAFRDSMWNKKQKMAYLMWPTKDMFETMGLEFTLWHSGLRVENNVFLKVIQKHSDLNFEETTEGAKELLNTKGWGDICETRTAPKDTDWKMSFWIYGNKCMFASGGNEKIAFVVDSKEFSDLMLVLWKQMWEVSGK